MCDIIDENGQNSNQGSDPLPPNRVRDHKDLAASLRDGVERQEAWWLSQKEELESSEKEETGKNERESKTAPVAKPRKRKGR